MLSADRLEVLDLYGFGWNQVFQTIHEPDPEVKRSMIGDVLLMWEFDGTGVEYKWYELFTRLRRSEHAVILEQLLVLIDQGFVLGPFEDDTITINPAKQEELMEFVGMWPEGFEPPEGTKVLRLTEEAQETLSMEGGEKYIIEQALKVLRGEEN